MENDNDKYREPEVNTTNDGWDVSVTSSVSEKDQIGEKVDTAEKIEPSGIREIEKVRYPQWLIILAIIGVCIIAEIVSSLLFLKTDPETKIADGFSLFLYYTAKLTISITFAWWICRKHSNLPAKPISFSLKKTNPSLILWGLILVIVTSMVIEPLFELFPKEYLENLNSAIGRGGWAMLTTIVMAPLLEEILFRGIIQQDLSNGYGKIRGVIMAAAIFGVIHLIPQQAINAFFIGIILGYLYIRTGSLVTPILIHALNNAIAFLMMTITKGDFKFTRELFGNEVFYWIIYCICCVIFGIAGWKLFQELKKLDQPEAQEIPVNTEIPE